MMKGIALRESGDVVYAANKTQIALLGEADIELELGSLMLPTTVLVSNNVAEAMIGIDWLRGHNCEWSFANDELKIQGMRFPLTTGERIMSCRRVVVANKVEIPARSEFDV